jgi:WD40 repeat protein
MASHPPHSGTGGSTAATPDTSGEQDRGGYRYDAFLSYSHVADGQLAPAVQLALQRFARPWYRPWALRVFRDSTSLAATPELWPSIERAMDSSRHFVLLASPQAARSPWVHREVDWWLGRHSGGAARLLLVLTEGDICWDGAARDFDWAATTALPERLRGEFRHEPLWVDLRWARTDDSLSLRHPRFREAVADLAAPLHGRAKDDLIGEDVRQLRRTQRAVGTVVAVLSLLVAAAVTLAVVADQQRSAANNARDRVQEQYRLSLSRELARQSDDLRSNHPRESSLLAAAAWRSAKTPQARGSLLSAQARPYLGVLTGHRGGVAAVAFSPDAHVLASGGKDGTVVLWDVAGRRRLMGVAATGPVTRLRFSRDGALLAIGTSSGQVRLWDSKHRQALNRLPGPASNVNDLAFSPSGQLIAAAYADGSLRLWDVATRHLQAVLAGSSSAVLGVAFSPDGRTVSAGTTDGSVRRWAVATGQLIRPLGRRPGTVVDVAFSPDGHLMASATYTTVQLWDARNGQRLGNPIRGHTNILAGLAFSRDGRTLATASFDQTVRLWDTASQRGLGVPLVGHSGGVLDVAFSPDGQLVASVGTDGRAMLWAVPRGHDHDLVSSAFSSDESMIATARDDGSVRVWSGRASVQLGRVLTPHQGAVNGMAFSPDGRTLLTVGSDRTARFSDVGTHKQIDLLSTRRGPLTGATFSPTGRTLAILDGMDIHLRDLTVRRTAGVPAGVLRADDMVWCAVFSPDGRYLAAGYFGGAVLLWDVRTRQVVGKPLSGHTATAGALAFSHDGRLLATGGWDSSVRLWDTASHRQLKTPLEGHTGHITSLAFSPDDHLLASTGQDESVRVWDVAGHGPFAVLTGQSAHVGRVAFDTAGRLTGITAGSEVLHWDTDGERVRVRACRGQLDLGAAEWARLLPPDLPYRPGCAR